MPKITFINTDGSETHIEAEENCSIMQAAVAHKIKGIDAICSGSMACGTCHIYIHPNWQERVEAQNNEQSEEEKDILEMAFDTRETSRLSCQIQINSKLDGLIVALPGTKTQW